MVSRDNKTPLPRKEFPSILTPLRDNKSGGDGESENDNWKNRILGRLRRFRDESLNPSRRNRSKSLDLRSEDNLRTIFLAAHVADI